MENNSLQHYGVLGMKWGIRRTEAQLARAQGRVDKLKVKKKEQDRLDRAKKKLSKLESEESSLKSHLKKGKGEDSNTQKQTTNTVNKKRSIKDLSDDELKSRIERLSMEKRLRELMQDEVGRKSPDKGREFVTDVLRKSGNNIATQASAYAMGRLVNKMFEGIAGEKVVDPKNIQKKK